MDNTMVWTVIFGLAVGSYGLRFIFLGLVGTRQLPEWLNRHLRYTAVAVLPGLVAPLVLWPAATGGTFDPARLAAAAVTFCIGYWIKNTLLAIFGGALTLYLGIFFL